MEWGLEEIGKWVLILFILGVILFIIFLLRGSMAEKIAIIKDTFSNLFS